MKIDSLRGIFGGFLSPPARTREDLPRVQDLTPRDYATLGAGQRKRIRQKDHEAARHWLMMGQRVSQSLLPGNLSHAAALHILTQLQEKGVKLLLERGSTAPALGLHREVGGERFLRALGKNHASLQTSNGRVEYAHSFNDPICMHFFRCDGSGEGLRNLDAARTLRALERDGWHFWIEARPKEPAHGPVSAEQAYQHYDRHAGYRIRVGTAEGPLTQCPPLIYQDHCVNHMRGARDIHQALTADGATNAQVALYIEKLGTYTQVPTLDIFRSHWDKKPEHFSDALLQVEGLRTTQYAGTLEEKLQAMRDLQAAYPQVAAATLLQACQRMIKEAVDNFHVPESNAHLRPRMEPAGRAELFGALVNAYREHGEDGEKAFLRIYDGVTMSTTPRLQRVHAARLRGESLLDAAADFAEWQKAVSTYKSGREEDLELFEGRRQMDAAARSSLLQFLPLLAKTHSPTAAADVWKQAAAFAGTDTSWIPVYEKLQKVEKDPKDALGALQVVHSLRRSQDTDWEPAMDRYSRLRRMHELSYTSLHPEPYHERIAGALAEMRERIAHTSGPWPADEKEDAAIWLLTCTHSRESCPALWDKLVGAAQPQPGSLLSITQDFSNISKVHGSVDEESWQVLQELRTVGSADGYQKRLATFLKWRPLVDRYPAGQGMELFHYVRDQLKPQDAAAFRALVTATRHTQAAHAAWDALHAEPQKDTLSDPSLPYPERLGLLSDVLTIFRKDSWHNKNELPYNAINTLIRERREGQSLKQVAEAYTALHAGLGPNTDAMNSIQATWRIAYDAYQFARHHLPLEHYDTFVKWTRNGTFACDTREGWNALQNCGTADKLVERLQYVAAQPRRMREMVRSMEGLVGAKLPPGADKDRVAMAVLRATEKHQGWEVRQAALDKCSLVEGLPPTEAIEWLAGAMASFPTAKAFEESWSNGDIYQTPGAPPSPAEHAEFRTLRESGLDFNTARQVWVNMRKGDAALPLAERAELLREVARAALRDPVPPPADYLVKIADGLLQRRRPDEPLRDLGHAYQLVNQAVGQRKQNRLGDDPLPIFLEAFDLARGLPAERFPTFVNWCASAESQEVARQGWQALQRVGTPQGLADRLAAAAIGPSTQAGFLETVKCLLGTAMRLPADADPDRASVALLCATAAHGAQKALDGVLSKVPIAQMDTTVAIEWLSEKLALFDHPDDFDRAFKSGLLLQEESAPRNRDYAIERTQHAVTINGIRVPRAVR